MDYQEMYRFWCTDDYFDAETKAELLAVKDDDKEIRERFYKSLEFGGRPSRHYRRRHEPDEFVYRS